MEQTTLTADMRTKQGKGDARKLRKSGKIPAVYYGKSKDNLHLSINPLDLEKIVAKELGMNTLIQLKVDGGGEHSVMLKDYQADSIKRNFIHVDFVHVDLAKKIQIRVPIHLVGRPIGVKEGGILEQITRELEVLCLPTNIPKQIDVEISALKIGDNLHLDEVKLPEGVEPREKINVPIAAVIAQQEEVVEAPVAPGTMVEPEVLTAKKVEGEAEGAPEAKGKEGAAKLAAKPTAAKPPQAAKPEQKGGDKK